MFKSDLTHTIIAYTRKTEHQPPIDNLQLQAKTRDPIFPLNFPLSFAASKNRVIHHRHCCSSFDGATLTDNLVHTVPLF